MSNRLLFVERERLRSRFHFMAPRFAAPRFTSPGFTGRSLLSWVMIRRAWRRYRTRQRIADLDGHMLKDIGISYADAETEANKPFWHG